MLGSIRTLLSYSSGRAFGRGDLVLHVMGYPARLCDRSCDHHMVTATWLLPHGYRYTATATRSPPHGHRHTVTATRPPPHGHRHTATATRLPPYGHRHTVTATRPSHPWPGHVPSYVPSYVPGYVPGHVISYVPGYNGTFNHGNLPRALSPRALSAALGPLAPTAAFSF